MPAAHMLDRVHMLDRERCGLALLAVSGAAFMPHALNRFVFIKLAVASTGILLASTVPPRGRLPLFAVVLLSLGGLLILVAALLGATPDAQLLGRPPRYEGIFVLPVYLGACVAGARLCGAGRARGATQWLLRWLAIAALAIGSVALLEAVNVHLLSSDVARPGSLLGNASDEGAWAVLALGPLLSVAVRVRDGLYVAGAIGAGAALVCAGSRGALIGALVAIAVLGVLTPGRGRRLAIAGALIVLICGALALPTSRARILHTSGLPAHTVIGRGLLLLETVRLLEAHPVLGVGPSGYGDAIPAYHTRGYELAVGSANPPDSPHDWVLQAAVAGGPLLALVALALCAMTFRVGLAAARSQPIGGEGAAVIGMLAGVAGYAVALLFHFTSPGTTPLAALFAGALLGGRMESAAAVPARRMRMGRALTHSGDGSVAVLAKLRAPAHVATCAGLAVLTSILAAAALAEIPLRAALVEAASAHLVAAQDDFHIAEALRPWDAGIAATAVTAYAALARAGAPGVAQFGAAWSGQVLAAFPRSVQVLEDIATLAEARHDLRSAERLLTRATRIDPSNPNPFARLASIDLSLRRPTAAIARARAAIALGLDDAAIHLTLARAQCYMSTQQLIGAPARCILDHRTG
jgi:hypothetical protein